MKKLNIGLGLAMVLLMLSSCADDALAPIITFDKAIKGSYVRLISESARLLDLANLSTASYTYTVEFVDEQQGNLVNEYELSARFIDNSPDNGDNSAGPVVFRSYGQSDLSDNARGYRQLDDISVTLAELASTLGVDTDKLLANDQFRVDGRILTSDGKEFSFDNSSAAINGSAFQGHFRITLKVTCPLDDNLFVGTYALTYDKVDGGWDESLVEGDVTVKTVAGSTTKRQFDAVFLGIFGGFDMTGIQYDFVCDQVVMEDFDTGVSCGSPGIVFIAGEGSPVDISDPSAVIVLNYVEDTGACGAGTPERIMRLTPK